MLILERYPIIRYNFMWDAKVKNDMGVNKVGNIGISVRHKQLWLNPLSEIFNHDDYELMST